MFTGIIESIGKIIEVTKDKENVTYRVSSNISNSLKVDQSISHDGVCLTVVNQKKDWHEVTAIHETLSKTNLRNWDMGRSVNLERCMLNNGRFDGHIVQGHVDQIGEIKAIIEEEGSWRFDIEYERGNNITVEKGSITVNGISLTCFNSDINSFSVAIIPYTYENTNLSELKAGDVVNLEFDIIGKYVEKLLKR